MLLLKKFTLYNTPPLQNLVKICYQTRMGKKKRDRPAPTSLLIFQNTTKKCSTFVEYTAISTLMRLSQPESRKKKSCFFLVLLICFLFISSWFSSFVCKCLSASCWSQREQKYRCSVNQGCSACATADKVAPESAAVLRSLHQPTHF